MNSGDVMLRVLSRQLLGPAVMVAAGLVAKGYVEVGDGFSAGVIVALAVALSYITAGAAATEQAMPVLRHAPAVAVGGLVLSLVSGFFPLLTGEPPFSHEPGPGSAVVTFGTVELFTPLLFDIGILLVVVGLLVTLLHQLTFVQRPGPDTDPTRSGGPW